MGAPRRKNLITSRRRVDDDGDEEGGSVAVGVEDDSSSEGSVLSDMDDDADAEGSETSDMETSKRGSAKKRSVTNTTEHGTNGKMVESTASAKKVPLITASTDTEAMMNGLKISGDAEAAEEINFDDMGEQQNNQPSQTAPSSNQDVSGRPESLIDRRRREHEDYKKKRDADPAFVPNRGGFFMHDHRSAAGQNGFRPSGRGRGRGRGGFGGQFSPIAQVYPPSHPADAPWAHDLHETVDEPEGTTMSPASNGVYSQPRQNTNAGNGMLRNPHPNRSFSRTTQVGNVQIRVYLSGMQEPIVFSAVPFNQHTRLPHHRPPLRRDKPVRISLPTLSPRYIFPAVDRSFIFIPRALRPNQQGFGRGRGRGNYSTYGGYPSGRTSAYGGSNYSASVAMSRRSSLARELPREGHVSPAGSTVSRNRMETGKPVVRLPPAVDQGYNTYPQPVFASSPAPVVNLPLPQAYSMPQMPIAREHRPSTLPMHQPRPQKQVSLADIESPATLNFNPPQQSQQQPFHHQVPPQVNGHIYPQDPNLYPHSRHPSHPSQRGTPLSQIPERAIHAQPFQPYPYHQQQAYFPQQFPPPLYYYPAPTPTMPPSVTAPAFVPGHQYPYVLPQGPPSAPPEAAPQAGTVAHESNGMVYYYDSSQLPANTATPPAYPTMTYAPPHGYMMPQPGMYYPTQ